MSAQEYIDPDDAIPPAPLSNVPPGKIVELTAPRELGTVGGEAEIARAVAEVQAQIMVAQRVPRNVVKARERILDTFTDPLLCEKAMYAYPRGGETVKGLSIRALEAIAANWGNFQFGWDELERHAGDPCGHSQVRAWAWDVETNTVNPRTFRVDHVRDTKKGTVYLKDGRDIYECVANMAARRQRAVMEALIPYGIKKAVIEQVDRTMHATVELTPEKIAELIKSFQGIGVSQEALEKRIRRRMKDVLPMQYIEFRRIWKTIKDGLARAEDYFELETTIVQEPGTETQAQRMARELAERATAAAAKQQPPEAPQKAESKLPAEPIWTEFPATRFDDFFVDCAMAIGMQPDALKAVIDRFGGRVTMTNAPGVYDALKAIERGDGGDPPKGAPVAEVAAEPVPTAAPTPDEQVKAAAEAAGITTGKLNILKRAHATNGVTADNLAALLAAIGKEAAKP